MLLGMIRQIKVSSDRFTSVKSGKMISDLNRSLGSRQFLNVANERTCFASCAFAFKITGLFTRLESTSD